MMARVGKWPGKKLSLMVMHLYPTAYLPDSHSNTRSTSRKGNLGMAVGLGTRERGGLGCWRRHRGPSMPTGTHEAFGTEILPSSHSVPADERTCAAGCP